MSGWPGGTDERGLRAVPAAGRDAGERRQPDGSGPQHLSFAVLHIERRTLSGVSDDAGTSEEPVSGVFGKFPWRAGGLPSRHVEGGRGRDPGITAVLLRV